MGTTQTPSIIDREIGYLRKTLLMDLEECAVASLAAMDDPRNVPGLEQIGAKAAAAQIKAEQFPTGFDV